MKAFIFAAVLLTASLACFGADPQPLAPPPAPFGPQRLWDGDRWSAWITDDAVHTPEVVLELAGEKTFNLIRLREDIRLGQRVEGVAVDVWDEKAEGGAAWKEIAKAQSVGACRLWRRPKTAAAKLRLRVTQAPVAPALSDVGLFMEPEFEARK